MEVKLQSILEEGEQLLWSSRPEPIGTLQGLYKSAILRKILMIAAGIVILAGWYISAAVKNGVEVQPIAIIVCALPFLYSIYNDFSDAKTLRERTLYAMTDRRMITVVDKAVSGVEYDKVEGWKVEADADGVVSLVCGCDALKGKERSRREFAVCGARTNLDTGLCESYVMYGITEEADKIAEIAAKYIRAI